MKLGRRSCSTDAGPPRKAGWSGHIWERSSGSSRMTFSGTRPCCWTGTKRTRSSTVQAFPVWKSSSPHSGKRRFRRALMTGEASEPPGGVDYLKRIGAFSLLPRLQPGKAGACHRARISGKRPGHEQFEALLEQRKIGPPIRPEEKPGKPGEQETHGEREQDFPAPCWHFGHSAGALQARKGRCDRRGLISAGVLEGTVFLGGYSGDGSLLQNPW